MIIVTGAAGFIGSNLLATLESRGYQTLVACDYLYRDTRWNNVARRNLYDFVTPENLFDYLNHHKNHVEVILHMGAISSTAEQNGDEILKHNYRLSLDLFRWCGRHRARFIYASSAATYGGGEHGFLDSEAHEYMAALRPLNLYGWSKHAVDRTILNHVSQKDASHSFAVPPQWAGLKFFNVYGPNEYHKGSQSSVIPHFVRQIQSTGTARLFKSMKNDVPDGGQARDFVSVHDVVNVMIWLMEHPEYSGLFNVGSGQARMFLDMARTIFKALDQKENIEFIPMPEAFAKHYQYFTEASMEKLRSIGYSAPMTPLDEGVKDYIHSYLLKDDPYR